MATWMIFFKTLRFGIGSKVLLNYLILFHNTNELFGLEEKPKPDSHDLDSIEPYPKKSKIEQLEEEKSLQFSILLAQEDVVFEAEDVDSHLQVTEEPPAANSTKFDELEKQELGENSKSMRYLVFILFINF